MICPECKKEVSYNNNFCQNCGFKIEKNTDKEKGFCPFCNNKINPEALKCIHCDNWLNSDNNKTNDKNNFVPKEIKHWNWGAFMFTWIWGISNNVYKSLLIFIPLISIVMPFILGSRGNEWAWKNKKWGDLEQFEKTQDKWNKCGIIFFILSILFFAMASFYQNRV